MNKLDLALIVIFLSVSIVTLYLGFFKFHTFMNDPSPKIVSIFVAMAGLFFSWQVIDKYQQ